jgi:hypothetical protein
MIRTRLPGFLNAYVSKAGLWLKDIDLLVPRFPTGMNVRGAIYLPTGEKLALAGHNLVSTAGELHYAQLIAQESPTNAFGVMELASAVPGVPAASDDRSDYTIISSSEKAFEATYPKRNDGDADNTGAGVDVFTYKCAWSAAAGNWADIDGGIITNSSPGASEAILTGFTITNFAKDSSTSLNLWVNHAPTGV